jgi:superoxide reductase
MRGNQNFLLCRHCGNIIAFVHKSGVPITCCGEEMNELVPNTAEASVEKHLPEVTEAGTDKISVRVGSAPHPMEEKHHIAFVYIATEHGGQRKNLKAGDEPELSFSFSNDKPAAVYAYCNLHGLWKTEIK